MKKLIAMLLAFAMLLGTLAGCGNQQTVDPDDQTTANAGQTAGQDETQEAQVPESETPLKLQWSQSIGIDTLFESPAKDMQSLYPYMVFDSLMYWDGANGTLVPAIATDWNNNSINIF